MKNRIIKWIRFALFIACGALAGYAYYRFVGCPTGSCPITSSLASTMLYTGMIGGVVSIIFEEGRKGSRDP